VVSKLKKIQIACIQPFKHIRNSFLIPFVDLIYNGEKS